MISSDKIVSVLKLEQCYLGDVVEFQKTINDAISKIPKEYKKRATISITTTSCGCYGDYTPDIEIYYVCPKTEEESKKEKRQEKYREKARIFELEQELARLKKNAERKE